MAKNIAAKIILNGGKAVKWLDDASLVSEDPAAQAALLSNMGADILLVFDQSEGDQQHDESLTLMREMARICDCPMWGLGNIERVEDVKKIIYAGCKKAVLNLSKDSNVRMLKEVSERFGKERIAVCVDLDRDSELPDPRETAQFSSAVILMGSMDALTAAAGERDGYAVMPMLILAKDTDLNETERAKLMAALVEESAAGLSLPEFEKDPKTIREVKSAAAARGIEMNIPSCTVTWDDLKTGEMGLVPVVVQDYVNEEVLMVAYMNREAFDHTVATGRMTYWSRSRQELWIKGETSGHYQYLKELRLDCDSDTLLAKVAQVGAACHTGNRSCFYRTVLSHQAPVRNPMKIFEQVFDVIEDRKRHPKEGSYTNYLFDKGIDKILKKCGEEASEIIIAAKNPNPEEVKYEMADFLYHMMVLMSERGITWDDIAQELANR